MPLYKWFVIIISVAVTLIYPEYVFGAIGILLLVIVLLLVVIDLVVDVYIVVAVFLQKFRDK
ncbi:MAG: hypothetical protein B5M46_02330 [Epsilonproteobacteria bacterium 4484_20]|nr:MAG: hypothetical protein B5M46_02330 [Epsilonproteobacteria bacterium 4484_20]